MLDFGAHKCWEFGCCLLRDDDSACCLLYLTQEAEDTSSSTSNRTKDLIIDQTKDEGRGRTTISKGFCANNTY